MKRWLSLLRFKNLLLVAATQSAVWWALPAGNPAFLYRLLLVLSTVSITAGGYLINDWYDVDIDRINKPQKFFLQSAAQQKAAQTVWKVLSGIGVLLALPPAMAVGMPALLVLQVGTVLALWWYAATGKRLPVIGNILVAVLTALSIELPQFYVVGFNEKAIDFLAVFAFLLTWAREIVKDLQDEAGDRAGGCKTLPVLAGRGISVFMASVLGGLVLVPVLGIAAVLASFFPTPLTLASGILLLLLVAVPLIVWLRRLKHCYSPADYGKSSNFLKGIMGIGILLFAASLFAYS